MQTVRIYRLKHLDRRTRAHMRNAQLEAARVWMYCLARHQQARSERSRWPDRDDLQRETKGGQYEPAQPIGPAGLPAIPRQCRDHQAPAPKQPAPSLSLSSQEVPHGVLACPGGWPLWQAADPAHGPRDGSRSASTCPICLSTSGRSR